MRNLVIPIKRTPEAKDLPLPEYQTAGAAAMDIYAAVKESATIGSLMFLSIPCGFSIAIPPGFAAQIRPRSGLAAMHGVTVLNSPGTIDSDFRGEVQVILVNLSSKPFTIQRGMRIAQMTVEEVVRVEWREQAELGWSERGEGGFGHTGDR